MVCLTELLRPKKTNLNYIYTYTAKRNNLHFPDSSRIVGGHVISHSLPGDASMVAITRYYVAPPVASGYFLQPFSRIPPTQIPRQQGQNVSEQLSTSDGSSASPQVSIDPVSHPDDAFPHQSPFHPNHKGDKPRSPFDPRFRVHREEVSDAEWSDIITESFTESGLIPRVLRSAPSGLGWVLFIDVRWI